MAFLILASDSPTYLPINLPISSLRRGTSNKLATAFAFKDLPHPGTPAINTPLGISTPNSKALSIFLNTLDFFLIHSFKFSSPPISSILSFKGIISSMPDFLIICCFCSKISFKSLRVNSPSVAYANAIRFSISNCDNPLKFIAISSNNTCPISGSSFSLLKFTITSFISSISK